MKLQFIGKDGSMGLERGKVYYVEIYTIHDYIVVNWGNGSCPYRSPQTLAANWRKPR